MLSSLLGKNRTGREKSALFLSVALVGASFGLLACEEKAEETDARTAPWRRDEAESEEQKRANLLRYDVSPGQTLEWDARGRTAKPQGTIGGIDGHVEFRLKALEKAQGLIGFDLSSLEVAGSKEQPEDWTAEAKRWLGLSGAQADEFSRATFELQSLRDLSHRLAHKAARRSRDDGRPGEIRRLYATAVGKLSLRSLSVSRKIPLTIQFYFDEPATEDEIPSRIVVELRGGPQVPLAEYEIVPRDEKGHLVSEKLPLLGQEVGRSAKLSGKIEFLRSQP